MRVFRTILLLLVIFFSQLAAPVGVMAFPPFPSSFYGSAQLNSANVPDGTLVQAVIDGQIIAYGQTQTNGGVSVYSLDVPGDDPATAVVEGGHEGDLVQFKIGGLLAEQSGVWHSATNIKMDLTATSTSTILPPQATQTSSPTRTFTRVAPTQTRDIQNEVSVDSGLTSQTGENEPSAEMTPESQGEISDVGYLSGESAIFVESDCAPAPGRVAFWIVFHVVVVCIFCWLLISMRRRNREKEN